MNDLERLIDDDPTDEARWLVWADALQSAGDPRGELVVMALRGQRVDPYIAARAGALFGAARAVHDGDPFANQTWTGAWEGAEPRPIQARITYGLSRFGLIDSVRVDGLDEEGLVARMLQRLLASPMGRFTRIVELAIGEVFSGPSGSPNLGAVMKAIAAANPTCLHCLAVRTGGYQSSWTATGNMGPLLAAAPRLEELDVEHGQIDLGSALDLPRLRALSLETGGLSHHALEAIARASWPALTRLELFVGCKDYGCTISRQHVEALLANPLPELRVLALCNAEIQGEIAQLVTRSPLIERLTSLDLSKGTLSDEEAEVIAVAAPRFAHLESLDLSSNYLSPPMVERLARLIPRAKLGHQRYDEMMRDRAQYGTPDWATTGFRYTILGE